jgi:hypothetical protein
MMQVIQQRYNIAHAAMNARQTLKNLEHRIVADARKLSRAAIDDDATFDRDMVAQAVRNSGGEVPAEPPPNFSSPEMSNREFERIKRTMFR